MNTANLAYFFSLVGIPKRNIRRCRRNRRACREFQHGPPYSPPNSLILHIGHCLASLLFRAWFCSTEDSDMVFWQVAAAQEPLKIPTLTIAVLTTSRIPTTLPGRFASESERIEMSEDI
jgi:hypothetical protein